MVCWPFEVIMKVYRAARYNNSPNTEEEKKKIKITLFAINAN